MLLSHYKQKYSEMHVLYLCAIHSHISVTSKISSVASSHLMSLTHSSATVQGNIHRVTTESFINTLTSTSIKHPTTLRSEKTGPVAYLIHVIVTAFLCCLKSPNVTNTFINHSYRWFWSQRSECFMARCSIKI